MSADKNNWLGTENCYRIAAVLEALRTLGIKEALVPDIAHKAMVSQQSVRYWIKKLECLGIIEIHRDIRNDSICRKRLHIITKTKDSYPLYATMFLEKWEHDFFEDMKNDVKKRLQIPCG